MAEIRGKRTHMTLFGPQEELVSEDKEQGRNDELIAARNEHLLTRYFWYAQDPKLAYDWIVAQLGKEFYLRPYTVSKIIYEDRTVVMRLKKEGLDLKKCREQWEQKW